MTVSELNIAANTPNLSSDLSSLSFTRLQSTPRKIARPHGVDRSRQSPHVYTFTGASTSFDAGNMSQTSTKRQRTGEGKENAFDEEDIYDESMPTKNIKTLSTTTSSRAPLGLGVKIGSVPSLANKAKTKARVGIRRL